MKLNEQDLKNMIQSSMQKAFSKNISSLGNSDAVTDNFISMSNMKNMVEDESEEETDQSSDLKPNKNSKGKIQSTTPEILNKILMQIVKDSGEAGETTEATGASASGSFSAPLFTNPVKNTLFQPGTETKHSTKPKGGPVNEEEKNENKIKGGKADNLDIEDIAKMHGLSVDEIYDEFQKGVSHEMEHTSEMMVALEIALDHLYEDPEYYTKLESVMGGETTEATTSSSAGVYDAPFGAPKKDPLKLSNPDTVEKELRAVKDKNFPKYGGPGGKFVKVKKKCSKFPYCNQGDINALEFFERDMVKEMVTKTAKSVKTEEYVVRNIIAKELGYIREQYGEYVTISLPNNYKSKSKKKK